MSRASDSSGVKRVVGGPVRPVGADGRGTVLRWVESDAGASVEEWDRASGSWTPAVGWDIADVSRGVPVEDPETGGGPTAGGAT